MLKSRAFSSDAVKKRHAVAHFLINISSLLSKHLLSVSELDNPPMELILHRLFLKSAQHSIVGHTIGNEHKQQLAAITRSLRS